MSALLAARASFRLVLALPALAVGLALTVPGAAAQSAAPAPGSAEAFLQGMAAHFDANPELKTTPGSGWKPYNRIRWAREQMLVDGQLPPNDARWIAWEQKRALEQGRGVPPAWFSLGPVNFGGRMLSIDFDPANTDVAYAGAASGGLFKSTDGGATWTPMTDHLPSLGVGGVAVSRTVPGVVVIGTGEPTINVGQVTGVGILRSTDDGVTWSTTDLTYERADGHGFHVMTAGQSGVFLGGAVDGIYRSTDDGVTWTQVMGTTSASFVNGWYDIQFDPEVPSRAYAVKGNDTADNGVYVSEDDGLTWNLVGAGQPPSTAFGKSKLAVSGSTVYCYVGDPGFGGGVHGLIKSTDDGATWNLAAGIALPSGQSWYNLSCIADPDDADRVFCGAVRLARSENGGASFIEVDSGVHVDHHALLYEPGSTSSVWALSDGGVYKSDTDGGAGSWQDLNTGIVSYQFYDICVNNGPDPYYVMGGTQDNGTDKWSGTTTWAHGLGADGMVCNIDPTDGTTVYAEIQFGDHRKSTNSGVDFDEINDGITGDGLWITPVDQDQTNGDRLFTETTSGIFRTTNGGASWENVASHRATWISISPVSPNIVWSARGVQARRSIDGGDTWATTAGYGVVVGNVTKVLAHPTDPSAAFVTFSSFADRAKVVFTDDGGASWTDVSGDLPDMPVFGIAVNPAAPQAWYLATDLGVWFSTNGGDTWTPYGTDLPNAPAYDIEVKHSLQKLVIGTHGRGAWEADIAEIVATGEVPAPRPQNLMLDEPFPNPGGDRVLFRYAARSGEPVTLRVFDVRGRLVSSLERFTTGDGIIRTTPWLTDGVTSGLYFAVLQAGSDRLTRKVMIQR